MRVLLLPSCAVPFHRSIALGVCVVLTLTVLPACAASQGMMVGSEYAGAPAPMARAMDGAFAAGGAVAPAMVATADAPADRPQAEEAKPAMPPDPLDGGTADHKAPSGRLMIYRASLNILVAAVDSSVDQLVERVNVLGGFLDNRTDAQVTVRVPAQHFHALVKELSGYGQVTNQNIQAQDVTKQLFDLELRIETAERSRQRLLDILKLATKVDEILRIESEVRRLTQEIEQMKGEVRFLKDQLSFSTLTVAFFANAPAPTPYQARTRSRFEWINAIGIENVLNNF